MSKKKKKRHKTINFRAAGKAAAKAVVPFLFRKTVVVPDVIQLNKKYVVKDWAIAFTVQGVMLNLNSTTVVEPAILFTPAHWTKKYEEILPHGILVMIVRGEGLGEEVFINSTDLKPA